jgi:DNA-binding transcriptional ArsR family regulator
MSRADRHHADPGQDIFRAVADPSRRVLLEALAEEPRTFQQLHVLLPVSKSAVSQHLAILVAAGLVSAATVGRQRQYTLVPDPLEEIADWVGHFEHFWARHLDGLGAAMRGFRAAHPRRPARPPEPPPDPD